MSEEQEKLVESWLKKRLAERRLRKRLTIIALLFVACAITFIAVVMAIPGTSKSSPGGNYYAAKREIQSAVIAYMNNNYGELPVINGTSTITDSDYRIIDICALLTSKGGEINHVPDGCASINNSDNDNCDAGCDGCHVTSHYIWAVDANGSVYSTCIGEDCAANSVDYFQGVWP